MFDRRYGEKCLFREEKDYLHLWTTYERLAEMIEERAGDKTKRPEHGRQIHYFMQAAQALAKLWKRDSILPCESVLSHAF